MIIPIIYPSAGEFWLNSNPDALLGYSFNNRKLTNLPAGYRFIVDSQAANEIAEMLNLSRPLYLTSPHENYKRKNLSCVIRARKEPFPPKSFVFLKRSRYDIYMASPELTFLLAARQLDFVDLVIFGYDMCALYYSTPGRIHEKRVSFTNTRFIKDYISENSDMHGSAKALQAIRYVCDFSNSPMETRLAIFATFPQRMGGCGLTGLDMNKAINLTAEGKLLVGCTQIRGDLTFQNRVVVEYNSNAYHLSPAKYTDDMNRQTAFKLAGYKYIAITSGNTKYFHSLVNIMNVIRLELGMPPLKDNPARTELYFKLFP